MCNKIILKFTFIFIISFFSFYNISLASDVDNTNQNNHESIENNDIKNENSSEENNKTDDLEENLINNQYKGTPLPDKDDSQIKTDIENKVPTEMTEDKKDNEIETITQQELENNIKEESFQGNSINDSNNNSSNNNHSEESVEDTEKTQTRKIENNNMILYAMLASVAIGIYFFGSKNL